MDESHSAFVGLGANVGAPQAALERAVGALDALPNVRVAGVSSLYRTRPVGVLEQPDFLNAAVELQVEPSGTTGGPPATQGLAAMALLEQLKRIERDLGRQERQRWGPREVDLDLLLFGAQALRVERSPGARREGAGTQWLEVPHPAAHERLFVLAPLAELAPDLTPPGWGMSVAAAREAAVRRDGAEAAVLVGRWDASRGRWLAAPLSGGSDGVR